MQDKDSQMSSAGDFRDPDLHQPRGGRKTVQKRTFTRWMNVFLQKCKPPIEVHDLFTDIQDGKILMGLLEELTSCKLLYRFRSSPHHIFRLNNIAKALAFLDDRHVKLLSIEASGIADGVPSVVLSLIWSIILHFQIKEVTAGLQRHLSSSLSSLSVSSSPSSDLSPLPTDTVGNFSSQTLPSKGRKPARGSRYHGKAIKTLLDWVQRCTSKFGVEVHDFGKSWRSGLAFLALIKSINPFLVDLRNSLSRKPGENMKEAFMIAHQSLGVPPLLEPEDVTCNSPDEKSIITYVSMFLGHYSATHEDQMSNTEMSVNIPEIPNFGSLESVSFGDTQADDPKVQALLKSLEKSNEQRLWKRWARRSSGGTRGAWVSEKPVGNHKGTSRHLSVFGPISPLAVGVGSQEIQSWIENSTSGPGYTKFRGDESHFSLSSEEGIYNLSVLDSDEEEAYSYILELNKEVFQSCGQQKHQVARVEEETEEEMMLNGQEVLHNSNREGQDFEDEAEVRAPSAGQMKARSSFREPVNNKCVLYESWKHKSVNDDNGKKKEWRQEKMENDRLVRSGFEAELSETGRPARGTRLFEQDETSEKGHDQRLVRGREDEESEDSETRVKTHPCEEKAPEIKYDTEPGADIGRLFSATCQSISDGGGALQSLAACCDVTPLELQVLLVLWILVYCCLVLPKMNF
ncbi:interaptin isoform X2 [Thalassophryne amazonica]|uniref:interaptin isoform X2 n=1 Tax=Thalassophryne amazonica TaxID=390379 RepID=UPI0014719007|nr:interaptin isoform X2 [Thalassophryne amazonica]